MGRPRVKTIDDSQAIEEVKKSQVKATQKKEADSLVAKLQEELGIKSAKAERAKSDESKEDVIARSQSDEAISKDLPGKAEIATPSARDDGKKAKKPGKAKPRSKKYQEISKDLDRSLTYSIPDAVDKVKNLSYAKFNGTLEAHINTDALGLRGFIQLPYASGRKIRTLAFGKGATESGADFVGSDETLEDILKGKADFDVLITTPEWMQKIVKLAKILGPRGLMPNPKSGTITDDLKKAVASFQGGKQEYRTEAKAKVIHLSLGKLNQPNEELEANIKTALTSIGKSKMKKVSLSPSMGPAVKVNLASI